MQRRLADVAQISDLTRDFEATPAMNDAMLQLPACHVSAARLLWRNLMVICCRRTPAFAAGTGKRAFPLRAVLGITPGQHAGKQYMHQLLPQM
jgi:hypothetical protein